MEREVVSPALRLMIAIQVPCVLVTAFIPFGFDKPSSMGLDYGHFLLVLLTCTLAWLAGLIISAVQKVWRLLSFQALTPVLMIVAVFVHDRL